MADNNEPFQPLTLTIDWELYAHHLEHSDLSDNEKEKLIQTLWSIVVSFVDLGFGIAPSQTALSESERTDEQTALHELLSTIEIDDTNLEKRKEDQCHH